jgi:DNA-binding NarL/FixJ family response regulator
VGLQGLSSREQEIARRVADGTSNREIAEALVLAPKTVERHLTNILAKLGLRNRTELSSVVRSAVVRGSRDE